MYKRVYTIGCFDWFHVGHKNLLNILRDYGETVIVGIHDDNSIRILKNLKPNQHQLLKIRMENVKQYADIVYVIPDTDPTFFLECIVQKDDNKENACFIRADDMPNFPGRKFIEKKMSIKLIPYTEGISSTKIRNG